MRLGFVLYIVVVVVLISFLLGRRRRRRRVTLLSGEETAGSEVLFTSDEAREPLVEVSSPSLGGL